MRKGDATRARIIDAAAGLFEREGYSGAGLNAILEASAAPRGSLYFHFPGGKEELAVAAIEAASARLDADIEAALASACAPDAGLAGVIVLLAARLEASGFEKSCPIASVVSTSSAAPDAVRFAASSALASLEARLGDYLALHGASPEEAGRRAGVVLAAIEGGLALGRIHRSTAPLLRVAEAMPLLVGQG